MTDMISTQELVAFARGQADDLDAHDDLSDIRELLYALADRAENLLWWHQAAETVLERVEVQGEKAPQFIERVVALHG